MNKYFLNHNRIFWKMFSWSHFSCVSRKLNCNRLWLFPMMAICPPEGRSETVRLLISKSWSDPRNLFRYSLMVTLLSKHKTPYLIKIHTKSAIPVTRHTRGSDRILHLHGRWVYSVSVNCWVWVLWNFEKYVNPKC